MNFVVVSIQVISQGTAAYLLCFQFLQNLSLFPVPSGMPCFQSVTTNPGNKTLWVTSEVGLLQDSILYQGQVLSYG